MLNQKFHAHVCQYCDEREVVQHVTDLILGKNGTGKKSMVKVMQITMAQVIMAQMKK